MTGGDNVGDSLLLDLIEILVVEQVEVGGVRGNVILFLWPNPSSKDVVVHHSIVAGKAYLRSVSDIFRDQGTHCVLQVTHIVGGRLEFDLVFSSTIVIDRNSRV